jgi:hypothetical protein
MLLIVPSVSGGDGHAIDADSPGIYVQQIEAFIMDASTEEAGWPTRGNCRSTRRNS